MASLADRKEELYRELVRAKPPIMQGAVELLRGLHQAGVRLAVGSSAPRENIDLALRAMGALEWIPVVVSGGDVTRGKPDPQVFERCAAGLGLDPSRCVVIEDAPVGIEAAKACGMRTVAVLTYHPRPAFDSLAPNHVVERLADLTIDELLSLVR